MLQEPSIGQISKFDVLFNPLGCDFRKDTVMDKGGFKGKRGERDEKKYLGGGPGRLPPPGWKKRAP